MQSINKPTAVFYREQAMELALLALEVSDSALRVELLQMAAQYRRMAARATANENQPARSGGKSDSESA